MRKCKCSGLCGPQGNDFTRREFLGIVGTGSAAVLFGTPAWGAFELPKDEFDRWLHSLSAPSKPRRYFSDIHTDARMHLGGIGTGNVEIGVDGQFTTWQLFNTLQDGEVPLYFAVCAGGVAKLLQTVGGPNWPKVCRIEMSGEYPIAQLRFEDSESPVVLELTAFTPFAPLDDGLSSIPLAALNFRIHNRSGKPERVSVAAFMQNPVGYDATGPNHSVFNPRFGGNYNDILRAGKAGGLHLRATAAPEPTLDRPVTIFASDNLRALKSPPLDRPENLNLEFLDSFTLPTANASANSGRVIWLEEPPVQTPEPFLRTAKDAVQAGATLLFAGTRLPLLQAYGSWTSGKPVSDQIEFSDLPGKRSLMALLEELLPARFSGVEPVAPQDGRARVRFSDLELRAGAERSTAPDGTALISWPLGKGKVVITAGAVLEPEQAGISSLRQRAYSLLCGLVGATYTVPAGIHPKAPGFGTLALATLGPEPSVLPGFEDWDSAWQTFSVQGRFERVENASATKPSPAGRTLNGAVASTVTIPAGGSVEIPFLLAWHYPNKYSSPDRNGDETWMGCHYATRWADAEAVVRESAEKFDELRQRTASFRDLLYSSTLPWWLLDAVTANAGTIRHIGVVFRIANGDIYGWEGSNGCCQPTCTHVWGYEQALAHLFPALEREMRRIDYMHQQRPDGGINNRTQVPSPPYPTGEHPFTDGQASCILKAYREALNSPDAAFLEEYWPRVKRAVHYLMNRDARLADGQPAGILQDDQWNTYDEALHGVTTFISGYYLAALRAGEEWARRMGDSAAAEQFHAIFQRGQRKLIELCWNGQYFQQHLPDYLHRSGEVGPGCMADQLIGQWWAHQLGLGYILPKEMVLSSLKAIFKYNFKSDLTGWRHSPRAFAGAKDKGLIICTWPKGGRPPRVMLYSDEVWTGIEYQVAALMIYEGLLEEGLAIVKGARDRYDGVPRPPIPRNPWNEIECGGHYARAMSSWSLLLALSGWRYDGPRRALHLAPCYEPKDFRCLFTGPEGWGALAQSRTALTQRNQIRLQEGRLLLSQITVATSATPSRAEARCGGRAVRTMLSAAGNLASVRFERVLTLRPEMPLDLILT